MPLAFESLSHGTVAFGFFNIESDMLLLEQYFFFATDFCRQISQIPVDDSWEGFWIPKREDVGDLMGAIHGVRHTGFIGDVYRRFPFPSRAEEFAQRPEGFRTRPVMEALIAKYATVARIPFVFHAHAGEVAIGDYRFTRAWFHELIRYVWNGGMPRWRGQERPDYVKDMKARIEGHPTGIFEGVSFSESED